MLNRHTTHLDRLAHGLAVQGLFAFAFLLATGCATVKYDLHHAKSELHELSGHNNWPFYHSPHTGEIVPKHSSHGVDCYEYYEPPFYGYNATCWRRWPAGWVGCPMVEEEIIVEEPIKGYVPAPADVKQTPDTNKIQPAPPIELPEPQASKPSSRRPTKTNQRKTPQTVSKSTLQMDTKNFEPAVKPVEVQATLNRRNADEPVKLAPVTKSSIPARVSEAVSLAHSREMQRRVETRTQPQPIETTPIVVVPNRVAPRSESHTKPIEKIQKESAPPTQRTKLPKGNELASVPERVATVLFQTRRKPRAKTESKSSVVLTKPAIEKASVTKTAPAQVDPQKSKKEKNVATERSSIPIVDHLLKASYYSEALPESLGRILSAKQASSAK